MAAFDDRIDAAAPASGEVVYDDAAGVQMLNDGAR